jgi:hypothetical protein
MTFFLGFMCGLILGALCTHLAHEYMDAMLFPDKEKPEPQLWLRSKDEEKEK